MKTTTIDKFIISSIGVLWILIVWSVYSDMMMKTKCKDAGGISVSEVCINPSAIIEVD